MQQVILDGRTLNGSFAELKHGYSIKHKYFLSSSGMIMSVIGEGKREPLLEVQTACAILSLTIGIVDMPQYRALTVQGVCVSLCYFQF